MTPTDSFDRTGKMVALGVFVAMVVDGMDLQMLSLALPSLTKELQLTSVMAGALSTFTLLGMGIGGLLGGWLSDRIGRVAVTWWAVLVFSACTGLIAFCDAYWQIAVMRFVSGFGLAAVYSVGTLARRRVCTDPDQEHRARHPAGRLVGRLCDCGAALGLRDSRVRVAAAVPLRDSARPDLARDAARRAGSGELACRARGAPAVTRAVGTVRGDLGQPLDAPHVPALVGRRRLRSSSAITARIPGCRVIS